MTDVIVHQPANEMGSFDANDQQLVRYLGLNPNSPQDRAAVAVCRHYGFDPILKHVVVIPKGGVYITRDGLLNVAHRSGQLDGIVVEQDPTLDDATGEWVAKVTVYRKDMRHGFTYPGRYPAKGQNRDYAPEMALKAAEAHALRRAFDIGGLPTLDEHKASTASAAPQQTTPTVDDFLAPAPQNDDGADAPGAPLDASPSPWSAAPVETATSAPSSDFPAAQNRLNAMFAQFGAAGFTTDARSTEGRKARLDYCSQVLGREIASSKDMTAGEVERVIDSLKVDAAEAGGEQ
jgi:hypothetical protein